MRDASSGRRPIRAGAGLGGLGPDALDAERPRIDRALQRAFLQLHFDRIAGFHRRRVEDGLAAVARARTLAATKAGAVAFSRTGDPNIGEFAEAVVLYTAGEVPDGAIN